MFRNYLKIAIRQVLKQKLYAAINIFGLAIGVAAALFAIIFIQDELNHDHFHNNLDRMYRIGLHGRIGEQEVFTSNTCPPLAQAMINEIPQVEKSIRINRMNGVIIRKESHNLAFTEQKVLAADSNFFHFFDFKLLHGNPQTALEEPNSIILTEEMNKKYFDGEISLGEPLSIFNEGTAYKVTGICANPPSNSHIDFNFILSSRSMDRFSNSVWTNNFLYTYIITHPDADLNNIQRILDDLVIRNVGPEIERFMGVSFEQMQEQGGIYGFFIDAVKDIHLYVSRDDEMEPGGDIAYVYMIGIVGMFIIIIACINFMNLSTARSAGRAMEVGMRKSLGSLRSEMIGQFLLESSLYSLLATLIGVIMVIVLLPQFNVLVSKELLLMTLAEPTMIGFTLALMIVIGLFAGCYPALYLTSFRAAEVLKGKIASSMKTGKVRSGLVVMQFVISITLIIGTIIVYQQLRYTQNKNLGFNKENVLVISNTNRLESSMEAFKNKLAEQNGIVAASYANSTIPGVNNTTIFKTAGDEQDHIIGTYLGDYDHLETLGYQLKVGRNFSRDFITDSTAVIINEAAVKELGWDAPLEETLLYPFGDNGEVSRFKVIGVLKDFNFESLKSRIRPLVLRLVNTGNLMTVRYDMETGDAVAVIEGIWKNLAPNEPFDYFFLDDSFNELYVSEQRIGKFFTVLSAIAIFIACLGLFGLAAFMAEQRTKEIGIRKTLGASTFNITGLLSKEFIKLVLIAFVISIFPAWYFAGKWLENFAYRIEINPLIFLFGGIIALGISMFTVSYQSIRAAQTNPVDAIKHE